MEYEIIMCNNIKAIFKIAHLPLAQLAEHSTFNQGVGRSNRLRETIESPGGEIGRRKGLKIPRVNNSYRFKSGPGHHLPNNATFYIGA